MTEIRLQWSPEILHIREEILALRNWCERTQASALTLELMVKAGDVVYELGTHWVETRETGGITTA